MAVGVAEGYIGMYLNHTKFKVLTSLYHSERRKGLVNNSRNGEESC